MDFLVEAAIFLAAAVLVVPLSRRLGLGAILGYLAAGGVIGPYALGLIADAEEVLHFAEFGVVLLLFIIGLELHPSRLWVKRNAVFGLGGANRCPVFCFCLAPAQAGPNRTRYRENVADRHGREWVGRSCRSLD